MKKELQVCSFWQAKKLFDLGLSIETIFYWSADEFYEKWKLEVLNHFECKPKIVKSVYYFERYQAFNVAELGKILPKQIVYDGKGYFFTTELIGDLWAVSWQRYEEDEYQYVQFKDEVFTGKTEAIARANALIWMIEN